MACSPSLIDEISEALKQNRLRVRKTREMTKASQDCQNFAWNMSIRKQKASYRDYSLVDYWDVPAGEVEKFSEGGETVGRDEAGDYLYEWSPPKKTKKPSEEAMRALEEYTDRVKMFFEE